MMETRSKRRRLISISSNVISWHDVPARFESLSDDPLTTVLEFVGKKSYRSFGGVNKHCKEVYLNTPGMTKETFLYGYAPLSVIQDRYDSNPSFKAREALSKGVVFYNRLDVLHWALEEQRKTKVLRGICEIAIEEGRLDLLEEVWNNLNNKDRKRRVFRFVDRYAAQGGKLNVLKWIEDKGLSIDKESCALRAAEHGHLHIMQWLQEEKGLELFGRLYSSAAWGCQLHVMKWLREQACPWGDCTFGFAVRGEGNLDILQWLQDEGCPWPENDYLRLEEEDINPLNLEWLSVNGYDDRIQFR